MCPRLQRNTMKIVLYYTRYTYDIIIAPGINLLIVMSDSQTKNIGLVDGFQGFWFAVIQEGLSKMP